MAAITLGELAQLVDGRLHGSPDVVISDALPLKDAQARTITLVDHAKHHEQLLQSAASAVLTAEVIEGCDIPMILVEQPHQAFEKIVHHLRPRCLTRPVGVHCSALVDPSAVLGHGTVVGMGATIGANCVVGQRSVIHAGVHLMAGCEIGDDCEIFPNSTLYDGTRLGDRVLLHASVTIGSYGFGYRSDTGIHVRSAQLGWVEVENDVEIGAGTTIDRGSYGATRIGEGSKLDNQVQIGHNVTLGKHNLVCAQVGIAGSSSTGDYVVLAGQAGVADHTHLNDKVIVAAQSGVMQDVEAGRVVFGSPATDRKSAMIRIAISQKLPEMRRTIKELQREVESLRQSLAQDDLDRAA